ncbi:GtrA family protein [Streptococcus agalactiae]|uniref:GtrA family protein n=1 Tax=Streptococcus agalactiae TaxID=1311 RepID=UPI000332E792|nr:GtrA family protein [Streptococcus agalactiae]OTG47593.1 sugar translocase [Streptococcus agalactiae]OTG51767.1 sugar translocase [Streptococcus agalactiae]RRA78733.1 GtrA family protein [Streptococcus agalactiae]CCW40213.1 GtrA family protein [Streptococcus agalactiae ILRI005]
MINLLKKFLHNEVISYLIFGVLTTVVYIISRLIIFYLIQNVTVAAGLANVIAILFAFATNDSIVFKQVRSGWFSRLLKFVIARVVTLVLDVFLAYLLVERFPHFIGQFVNDNKNMINSVETIIGQVLVIILNYVLSKVFVFKSKK